MTHTVRSQGARLFVSIAVLELLAISSLLSAPRVAILNDPSLENESALLAVSLSTADLSLVERSEISKLAGEHEIASTSADPLQAGKLLGADAVLSMRKIRVGDQQALVTSILAVKAGVRLSSAFDPLPLKDMAGWSQRTSATLAALLPKLSVSRQEAIPLSVLNLRAPFDTPEAREQERTATALLAHGLARQKKFFVLEREVLDALAREKVLNSAEEEAFWTGCYVLDGELTPDSTGKLTLTLRVEGPGGIEKSRLSVSGNDLPALIQQAVAAISERLGHQFSPPSWDASQEAERFFAEAKSAFSAGLWQTSLPAAEAAAALGMHSEVLDRLRIQLHLMAALPAAISASASQDPWDYDAASLKASDVSPEHALTALDLFLPLGAQITKPVYRWNEDSLEELGNRVLLGASRVLRALYASGLAKTREYEALRVETRACGNLLLERVDSTHFYSQFHVAAVYAPLWEGDPDAVLVRYRSVLNEPLDGDLYRIYFLRYLFANVRDGTQDLGPNPSKMPWLLGDAAKWTEFVQSLRNSPRLQDRLDAWLIDFCSADAAARQEIERKIEAALWAARDEIFRDRITTGQLLAILEIAKPAPEFRARMLERYFASDAPFQKACSALVSMMTFKTRPPRAGCSRLPSLTAKERIARIAGRLCPTWAKSLVSSKDSVRNFQLWPLRLLLPNPHSGSRLPSI